MSQPVNGGSDASQIIVASRQSMRGECASAPLDSSNEHSSVGWRRRVGILFQKHACIEAGARYDTAPSLLFARRRRLAELDRRLAPPDAQLAEFNDEGGKTAFPGQRQNTLIQRIGNTGLFE